MGEYVELNRIKFPKELFDKMMEVFKESLSHTSLTCESAFTELNEKDRELARVYNPDSLETYNTLSPEVKERVDFMMRFFLVYEAATKGAISGDFYRVNIEDPDTKKRILETYDEYLSEYDLLYKDVIVFDQEGNFKERESFRAVMELFRLYSERKALYDIAHDMKKDHIEAFEYALSLGRIGAREIKEINRIVNQSHPDKEVGFKKVNNIVTGASFNTASKEETATRIAELLYGYQHNFDIGEVKEIDENSSREEKNLWLYQIMLKEAKFHIDFIRIHPFADGNGRTGRIILNCNLIRQGVAPILITDEMFDTYKTFISNCDYDGLAKCLIFLSSQQQSIWVGELRAYFDMQTDSIEPIPFIPIKK